MTYRIGSVDQRFNLSHEEVSEAVRQAAVLWEKVIGHKIFKEDPKGSIVIDLVYDYRQAVTDNLKMISNGIDDTKETYNVLMAQYEYQKAELSLKNVAYAADFNSYIERLNTYHTEMDAAHRKGYVSLDIHQHFKKQKQSLDAQSAGLSMRQEKLKEMADELNRIVALINDIASSHNIHVADYTNTRKNLSGVFDAGLCRSTGRGDDITIFQFTDHDMLVRVLAHELGHAMGLKHNNNPHSIMFYINHSKNLELSPEDISAMQAQYSGN